MSIDPDSLLIFKMRPNMQQNRKAPPTTTAQQAKPYATATQANYNPQGMENLQQKVEQIDEAQRSRKNIPSSDKRKPAQGFQGTEEQGVFVAPHVGSGSVAEAVELAGGDVEQIEGAGKKETRAEQASKEAAIGLTCVWHPWRPAYAVCDYCHRPFCFEDIIEQKGHYYCLEDIDKVAEGSALPEFSGRFNYASIGLISGALFIGVFLVFLIFASSSLASVISYSNSVGLFSFLSSASLASLSVIFGGVLTLLCFISGLLVMVHSKVSSVLGGTVGVLSIILFTYDYVAYGTLYSVIIAVLAISALVTMVYFRAGATSEEAIEEKAASEEPAPEVQFANVGRF